MSYTDAHRILTNKNPNLISKASMGQADRHRAQVYWVVLERDQATECVDYLNKWAWPTNYTDDNSPAAKTVTDPITETDTLEGVWKFIDAIYSEQDGQHLVVVTLEAEINTVAPITQQDSRWRYKGGKERQSGNGQVILELPFCDPATVQDMAKENSYKTYTDAIYTTNGGVLGGKWYSVSQEAMIDPETGYGVITWYLSRYYNQDLYFPWQKSTNERSADFFKLHMPPDTVRDFFETYYFSTDAFYVSTDETNYTNKNGEAETGGLPAEAKRLNAVVSGRIVEINEAPDQETNEITLHVAISWASDIDEFGVIYRDKYDAIATDIQLVRVTEARRDAFLDNTYIDSATGDWYYAENNPNWTARNGKAGTGSMPGTVAKLDSTVDGRAVQVRTAYIEEVDRWTVQVQCLHDQSDVRISRITNDSRLTFHTTPNEAMVMDKAFNVSEAQLLEAKGYYESAAPVGTVRNIAVERLPNGRFNFTAIEVTQDEIITTFRLGSKTTYFGYHSKREPTTDTGIGGWSVDANGNVICETHILIGGYHDAPDFKTQVDPTTNISPSVRSETDGTWSWNIEVEGIGDPITYGLDEDVPTSDVLFKYGIPEDEWHWVGRYLYEDITVGGAVNLTGNYAVVKGENAAYTDHTKEAENYDSNNGGWTQEDLSLFGEGVGMAPSYSGSDMAFQNIDFGNAGQTSTLTFRTVAPYNGGAHTTIEVRDGAMNGPLLCTLDCTPGPLPNTARTESHAYTIQLTGVHTLYFVGGSVPASPASLNWWTYQEGAYVEGEFGTHGDLTGRRIVIRDLRNEKIVSGKLSYDVYERVITADIEDDDGWFLMGTTESADRNKRTLASVVTNKDYGEIGSGNTILQANTNLFNLIENATMRRKTIYRERKYFVRRPRKTDLQNAGIYSEMVTVSNPYKEPNPNFVRTFDIIKLGDHNFAVERLTVQTDTDFYPDDDAVTKYAPGGFSACRRQTISLKEIEEVV
ncbi:MAG: carbohydrate-binding protein [Pontiellaceae bacterium]|nr:carbohydrate-binding protein [Pontiellaceae bacterium]